MEHTYTFSIADVSFAVRSEVEISVSHLEDGPYASFLTAYGLNSHGTGPSPATQRGAGVSPAARLDGQDARPTSDRIPVRIRTLPDDPPEFTDDQKLFDGDRDWAMYRDESGRHVVAYTGRRRRRRCIWQARIADALDELDIAVPIPAPPNPFARPLDEIVMTYVLARLEGVTLHGVAVEVAGKGLILAGRAGVGKAKVARILRRYDDCRVLSDARTVVRPSGLAELRGRKGAPAPGGAQEPEKWFNMFGTPWTGGAGIALNESAPLHAILFLAPGGPNRAVPLPLASVETHLMPVANIPWNDPEIAPVVHDFCRRIMASVPAYELQFKPRRSLVKYLRQFASTVR